MSAAVRLARESPSARQAGGATTIGVVLTLVGGVMLYLVRTVAGANEWLPTVVGSAFSLVGVLMLIFGIKLFLMTRLPETIVEVDRLPVRGGQPFRVTVRQPGPIRLRSLRLNLVGEQITKREVWRKGRRRTDTDRRLIHQDNVLDVTDITVGNGEVITREGEATVPAQVDMADVDGRKTVVWRLEVWGRVRGWVNFGHPFVIDVVGVAERSQPADS